MIDYIKKTVHKIIEDITSSIHIYTLTIIEVIFFILSHYFPELQKQVSSAVGCLLDPGLMVIIMILFTAWIVISDKFPKWRADIAIESFILVVNIYTWIIPYTVINVDDWDTLSCESKLALLGIIGIMTIFLLGYKWKDYLNKKILSIKSNKNNDDKA